eukprot:1359919-Rhodomonas_salina.4
MTLLSFLYINSNHPVCSVSPPVPIVSGRKVRKSAGGLLFISRRMFARIAGTLPTLRSLPSGFHTISASLFANSDGLAVSTTSISVSISTSSEELQPGRSGSKKGIRWLEIVSPSGDGEALCQGSGGAQGARGARTGGGAEEGPPTASTIHSDQHCQTQQHALEVRINVKAPTETDYFSGVFYTYQVSFHQSTHT